MLKFVKYFSLIFFLTADAIGNPPSTGSVILIGKGIVFSLNPNTGKIIRKCIK